MATRRYYIPDSDFPAGSTAAQVALAEEIIDNYVGFQHKYIRREFDGEITSLLADKKIIDQSNRTFLGGQYRDYYKDCVIEFLSGDHAGELRPIASSQSSDYSITYSGDTLNNLAVGDVFRIYQLAKFPRQRDIYTRNAVIYKAIPRAVRDAVIAQVEFILEMGDEFFSGADTDANSESIGNYSYQNGGVGSGGAQSATVKMVSPQARTLLRGIINRTGRIEV